MKTTNEVKFAQDFHYLTERFHQHNEFKTEFESMEVNEKNKCLSKFYVLVRRKDGSFHNLNNSLLSVRAALDHHLKSPPHNKNKISSATTMYLFSY